MASDGSVQRPPPPLPPNYTPEDFRKVVEKMRIKFETLRTASLDEKIKIMEEIREEARKNPATNTALLRICALGGLRPYALPSPAQEEEYSSLRFHAALTIVTIAGYCTVQKRQSEERQSLVAEAESGHLLEVLQFLHDAVVEDIEVHSDNVKLLRENRACELISMTLLKLSKTGTKIVQREELENMRKTHNDIPKTLKIRDRGGSVRTINPIVMVMGDPAIRILIAMCELGRSSVAQANADQLDTQMPVEPNGDTNSSDDDDGVASASVLSYFLRAAHDSDSSADISIVNSYWDSSIKAAALAAQAFAEIAADTWCRLRLVEAGALPALVSLLRCGNNWLQKESAAAVMNLSNYPLHSKYNPLRKIFVKSMLKHSKYQWMPLDAPQCGWISNQIVSAGALAPLLKILTNQTKKLQNSTEHVEQEVMIFITKVLYNLSRDSSNRNKMLKEEPIPILIASLRKYVDIGYYRHSTAQDLLTTLLYMSFTTPSAKRDIVKNGLVEFLAVFLDDTTCEQMQMTALEMIRGLSEYQENVPRLVSAPQMLKRMAALARYDNIEMRLHISTGLANLLSVPLSEQEQDLSLHAPERKLLHHLLLMGHKPEDNDMEVRLQVLKALIGLADSMHRANRRWRSARKKFRRISLRRKKSDLRYNALRKKDSPSSTSPPASFSSSPATPAHIDTFPNRTMDAVKYGWREAVPRLIRELECNHRLVQTEAAKGVTALANLSKRLQEYLVKNGALTLLAKIVRRNLPDATDPELFKEADTAITALGFKNGAQDLRQCAGGVDTQLMNDWFKIDVMLRKQGYMVSDVRRLASYAWNHKIMLGAHAPRITIPPTPAILRQTSFIVPQTSFSSPAHMHEESSPSSEDTKSEDEYTLSTSDDDDISAAYTATANKRIRRKRMRASTAQYVPQLGAGAIPDPVQDEFTFFFPSHLRQQLLLSSPLFKRKKRSAASHMNTLAVLMPQKRTYYSFRFSNMLSAVLSKYAREADNWCISFRDCGFHSNFCREFANKLSQFPEIESLSFVLLDKTYRSQEMDSNLVDLVKDMPPWIQWVTFNRCFEDVESALDKLCECLQRRDAIQAGLPGLAIINNDLNIDNIEPFIKFLDYASKPPTASPAHSKVKSARISPAHSKVKSARISPAHSKVESARISPAHLKVESARISPAHLKVESARISPAHLKIESASSSAPRIPRATMPGLFRGLKWLDLSGNKLGDKGVAKVFDALQKNDFLRGIDVSNNRIMPAEETMTALCGELAPAIGSDGEDETDPDRRRGLLFNNSLTALRLAGNKLDQKAVTPLLEALASKIGSLRYLDLSNNDIDGDSKFGNSGFQQVVKNNTTLQYLNLQNNKLTKDCGHKLSMWDLNEYLCFLLIDGNPEVSDQHRQTCENFTERNRQQIYRSASKPQVLKRWPFSPFGFSPVYRTIDPEEKSNIDASSPHELSESEDTGRPTPETTPTSYRSSSRSSFPPTNTEEDSFTTPQKPSRITELDDTDASTESRIKHSKSSLIRQACISLLLSAPLIETDEFGADKKVDCLEFTGERELLRRALRQSGQAIGLSVRRATTDNFGLEVTKGCRVLHYSGHGQPDCLCFENRYGGVQKMTAEDLKTLLKACKEEEEEIGLKLVIISACYSRKIAQAFVDAGVPHVICVKIDTRLHDAHAVIFTHHFYVALAQGFSVEKSFRIAKAQIQVQEGGDHSDQFLLLPEGGDHSDQIFADVPPACDKDLDALVESDDCMTPPSFPNICEHFDGRNMDVHRVLNAVLKESLVTLHGAKGSGKTSAAVAVCHYLWERRTFIGDKRLPFWAHFVRLEGHCTIMGVLRKLLESVSKDADVLEQQGLDHSDMREDAPRRRSKSFDDEALSPRNGSIGLCTDRLVKRLQTESERGRGKHQILLILDHCDDVLRHDAIQFRTLLGTLLRLGRHVKILAVSGTPLRVSGGGILEKTYNLQGLKHEDAMSLLLRCCPDAHGAIRIPAKISSPKPSYSDEEFDEDYDSSGNDPWMCVVKKLMKIPVLKKLYPYYPNDIYETANALSRMRGGLLGLICGGDAEKKAVMKIVDSKKDRNKKS